MLRQCQDQRKLQPLGAYPMRLDFSNGVKSNPWSWESERVGEAEKGQEVGKGTSKIFHNSSK